jgi:hypothetical protein
MNAIAQYSKAAQSLAILNGILTELAAGFSSVQARTTVDDTMIDALVAAANELSAAASGLKLIEFQEPTN